jgi:hypothetical protein
VVLRRGLQRMAGTAADVGTVLKAPKQKAILHCGYINL